MGRHNNNDLREEHVKSDLQEPHFKHKCRPTNLLKFIITINILMEGIRWKFWCYSCGNNNVRSDVNKAHTGEVIIRWRRQLKLERLV